MNDKSLLKETLIKYLENHEGDKDKPYMITSQGSFSLKQLTEEVTNETEVGNKLATNMLQLTIDLLNRGKEKI